MSARSYQVLGDVWRVPFALCAPEVFAVREPVVTVELLVAEGVGSQVPPPESSWLAGALRDGDGYVLCRTEHGISAWYPRFGTADFSSDLSSIHVRAERGTEGIWALLLAASIPAQRLLLLGDLCLHAGAFDHGGEAVLLVGPSGSGKSTLVASAADQGFLPLSDDAVRVARDGDRAAFIAGSSSLRLRSGAFAQLDARGEWTPTVDGRIARKLDAAEARPISFVVLLRPEAQTYQLSELSPAAAVTRLIAFGDRVLAVREPELVRSRFARWAALARSSRVFELAFPRASTRENIAETLCVLTRGLRMDPSGPPTPLGTRNLLP